LQGNAFDVSFKGRKSTKETAAGSCTWSLAGGHVKPSFDIFRELPVGGYVWIKTVFTIEQARQDLDSLARVQPGPYLIYDPRRRTFVEKFQHSA
jgi:hypothetical protein